MSQRRGGLECGALAAVLLVWVGSLPAQEPTGNGLDVPYIRVAGTGRAAVKPDVALINLGVEARASTAEAARSEAAQAMTAVLEAARKSGVQDKDMQSTWVGLNPVYAPDTDSRISGYMVSHQLTLKVRDVDSAGTVLDAAVKAGGDAARLHGLSFGVDEPKAAEVEARVKAYLDAVARGKQYAELAGVTLGKPIRISEAGTGIAPPIPLGAIARMEADIATPVQSGEQEVTMAVEVVFSIEEPAP